MTIVVRQGGRPFDAHLTVPRYICAVRFPLLHLTLFGRPVLRADGVEILGPGKPILLLAYLACQPRWRAGRGRLIDLLWGDVPPARGRQTLRQTILQLRRRVAADLVLADGDDLLLAPAVRVDRDRFLTAFERDAWAEAARLAAAPFLRDAVISGGDAFESWVESERHRCRDLVETAVVGACDYCLRAGDPAHAIGTVARWREADPTYEPTWQRLIAVNLDTGELSRARLEAGALIAALANAGVSPSPVTQELLARADAAFAPKGSPDSDPLLHPELVGRSELFAALIAAKRESGRGKTRRVLLLGDAGTGKTRLLQALGARVVGSELDVTTVRAVRTAHPVDGAVLAQLVLALGAHRGAAGVSAATARVLVAVAPDLATRFPGSVPVTDWAPDTTSVVDALYELLVVLAEDRPQALLLDDLQWWDSGTESVVCAALARCDATRLLVVATSRRPRPEFPADDAHMLLPLTVADVETLLQSIADADDAMLDRMAPVIHRASRGVPQLVLEAVHWLIDRGALALNGATWELRDETVLESVKPENVAPRTAGSAGPGGLVQ